MSDRTTHKIIATQSGTTAGGMDFDIEYEITYSYLPGAPAILNPSDNADPGWAPEISFVGIDADCDEHGVFKDLALKDLVAWAEDWLSEHYDECIDNAEADQQPDPDYQRDLRNEDRERDRGE